MKFKKVALIVLLVLIISTVIAKIYYELNGNIMSKMFITLAAPESAPEHKKISYTGYDIHYFVSGNPDGELIIFLHPAFSDHRAFDMQIDYFGQKYRVITVDMIGHGLSQVKKSDDKIDASARHISDIMSTEGYDKTHLVGVSMGSLVAQYFAVENPEKVLSLTSLGGYDINKVNPEVAKAQQSSNIGLIFRAMFSMNSFRAKVAKLSAYNDQGQALFYKSASLYTRKSFLVMRGFENIIKEREFVPTYPTLILVGEHDIPLARQMSQTWHADLPNSKYLQIDNAGHCANMDVPDIFNKVVDELLAGLDEETK